MPSEYKSYILSRLLFFSLLAFLTACSHKAHFEYEPNQFSSISPEVTSGELRIAVMAFEDARPNIKSGNVNYALIPLVPTWGQTLSEHQGERDRSKASYYYPGLLSYSIYKDLEFNQIGSSVHLDPAVTEAYDLVIRGKLTKLEFGSRKITYGLSYLGALMQGIAFPGGWVSVYSEADVEVYSPHRKELVYKGTVKGDWGNLAYSGYENSFLQEVPLLVQGGGRRRIHGVVDAYSEMSKALVKAVLPEINNLAQEVTLNKQKEVYYSGLDPDLAAAAKRAKSSGRINTFKKRIALLEKYRQKEFARLEQEDTLKKHVLAKRLEAIKAIREQINEFKKQAAIARREKSKLEKQQMAAVLVPVLQGLATRNKSGLYSKGDNIQEALKDFSAGAKQMKPINIPPFPADKFIAQLDRNLPGLPAVGADPFREYGQKTLPQIRQSFLRRYRQLF